MFKTFQLLMSPLSKDQRRLFKELQDYNIPFDVQKYYRRNIKNNLNDTYKIIKGKLIRNIILGKRIWMGSACVVFQYGNLEIFVDVANKEIYKLKNNEGLYKYDVDKQVKGWLDKYLNLNIQNNLK